MTKLVQRSHWLPSFERPEPPDAEREARWRNGFWTKFFRAEKKFGRGETYPIAWRSLILDGTVPEWIFQGILRERNPELAGRCEKAKLALERLRRDLLESEKQNR
jgi:hypothetical protein